MNKMTILEKIMNQALDEEKKGNYKKGIYFLEKAMKNHSELYIDILYEVAMLYFRNGEYYIALIKLIDVYRLFQSDNILNFIFESYVYPNQQQYKENYNQNKKLLQEYPLVTGENVLIDNFEDIKLKLIWSDEKYIIYYIDGEFILHQCRKYCTEIPDNCNVMLVHAFDVNNILEMEEKNRIIKLYISDDLMLRNPMYLYYEAFEFLVFFLSNDIKSILETERVVFLIGEGSLDVYFQRLNTVLPDYILNFEENNITKKAKETIEKRIKKDYTIQTKVKNNLIEYYKQNSNLIIENIKLRIPKMLFITSRYTTALQYHAKNLYYAAKKMGLNAHLLIEDNYVSVPTNEQLLDEMERLRPDIIVSMNHFRFELTNDDLFKEILFLVWVQDPMPLVMDKASPGRLKENDFILNHYISWKDFFDIGYDENKMISAPIPGNQDIYKPYELSKEEKNKYSCDICMVSHYSVIHSYIENEMSLYDDKSKEIIKNMYLTYYHQVLDEEKICYSKKQFNEFIRQYFIEQHSIIKEEDIVEHLADKMYREFGAKVYRQAMVKWILGAGYKNIKLWGYGWEEENDFAPYAMGGAENGEELSKILQASKIVIGNNYVCTSAARVWETMLSGGFYLSNYVPEEYDAIDVRMILEEDDFVMFKSKAELLEKIDFYLNHEKERLEMAQKGRESALQKMTFDVLMERILNQLNEKL